MPGIFFFFFSDLASELWQLASDNLLLSEFQFPHLKDVGNNAVSQELLG